MNVRSIACAMVDRHSEQVLQHPALGLLDELLVHLADAAGDGTTSPDDGGYIPRIRAVAHHLKARLRKTDASLVPLQTLSNAQPHLQNATNEIRAFISDDNEVHLSNADQFVDQALVEMRSLPPLPFRKEADIAVSAAKAYAEDLLKLETRVRETLEALVVEIQSLDGAADDLGTKLSTIAEETDQKRQELLDQSEAKLAELRTEIESQKTRLDDIINQQQALFTEAQEKRLNDFSESEKSREGIFIERLDGLTNQAQSNFEEILARAEESMDSLREHEQRAAQIVGVSAASKTAGAYLDEAAQQRGQANLWRRIALGIFALVILGTPAVTIPFAPETDASVTEIVTFATSRLPLAVALLAAAYAARQSGDHRTREQIYTRRALELTTFRPFLSELSDEQRSALIREAAQKAFFNGPKEDGEFPLPATDPG